MTIATAVLSPVELEVARHRLESVAEEVGLALVRTSYSPNIKDRRDCSAGIYTASGQLISQAENIPLHLGLMPIMITEALAQFGIEKLEPGDVLVTNDPYLGGSHLPDTCVITPLFVNGELAALVANMAHHVDIGGMTPGSMGADSTEIFQEGVRIPPVRIFRGDEPQNEILDLIMTNVRTSDTTRGDLMAQVAANRLGCRRIGELIEEWGIDHFERATDALVQYAEKRTRAAIAAFPDGVATFEDTLEHDGCEERTLTIRATVEVSGDSITVDLTETDGHARGAVNCSYAVAYSCVAYVVKSLMDPALPSNSGLMAPIDVRTRPGTLVAAQRPAPVAHGNTQTAQRIVDTLLGAFHQIAPGRVPAASSGSMSILTIGGVDPLTGRYFSYVETYGGGQGALPDLDGASAIHTHMTNTRNTPCEVIEREYPLRVDTYAIARGTGGQGRHRGGDGLVRGITLTRGAATAVVGTARVAEGPWGLEGGASGQPAKVENVGTDGVPVRLPAMSRRILTAGEGVRIQTAGGGGYGPVDAATSGERAS